MIQFRYIRSSSFVQSSDHMWKWKEDDKPAATPVPPPAGRGVAEQPNPVSLRVPVKEAHPVEAPKAIDSFRADIAHIGKSVVIKGELSGSEDLYLDGEVEGNIDLSGHSLVVGPNGRVRANIKARDIVVHGKIDGNVFGVDRVELKKSAVLVGDIFTQRIVIEDGAFFKGGIDIKREAPKEKKETPKEPAKEVKVDPAKVEAKPELGPAAAGAARAGFSLPLDLKK
jgi:cytoskeletal protein CcmA (bactofilin family)